MNPDNRFVPQYGKYPIPHATYFRQQIGFGKEERKLKEVTSIEDGWFIDFSPAKLDEIRDMGFFDGKKVSLSVRAHNGIHIAVHSYEDLRDTDYDELVHFGRKATPTERKIWIEQQGGPQSDKQKIEDFKYNMDLHAAGIQPRTPTVEETQKMIAEEIARTAAKANEQPGTTTINKKSHKQQRKE